MAAVVDPVISRFYQFVKFPGGVDFRDKFQFFQILLHTIVVLFSSGVDPTMKTAEVHDWGHSCL